MKVPPFPAGAGQPAPEHHHSVPRSGCCDYLD